MVIQPPQPPAQQQKGLIGRFINMITRSFQQIDQFAGKEWHALITNLTFQDVEAVGVSILEILGQLYMNHIMMKGMTGPDEAEGRISKFMSSAAGQGIVMGATNMIGSLPTMGQVNNLGQAVEGVAQNIGMGYMNYQMMQPIMTETMGKPMKSKYRETAKSTTFEKEDIDKAHKKGLISKAEAEQQYSDLGYRDSYSAALVESNYTEPDITTLQQMHAAGSIDTKQLVTKLRRNGYSNDDIVALTDTIVKSNTNSVNEEILSMLRQMAQDNNISEQHFADLLRSLGVQEDQVNTELNAVRGLGSVSGLQSEIQRLTDLYQQGSVSQHDLEQGLSQLGLDEQHIATMIEAQDKLIVQSNPLKEVTLLDNAIQKGILSEQQYMQQLMEMGLSDQKAIAKVLEQQQVIEKNNGTSLAKGNLYQTDINIAYAEGLIDTEQFIAMSEQIGTPAETITILKDTLSVRARKTGKPMPMQYIEMGIGMRVLDEASALSEITANGYSTSTAHTLLDIISRNASVQYSGAGDATSNGSSGSGNRDGLDISQLDANRYRAQLEILGITPEAQVSVVAMVYNSLIRSGLITINEAVSFMGTIGIPKEEALKYLS